jgi:hypothetical protein
VPLVQRAHYANENVRDKKLEKELAQKKLESHPEQVTKDSSTRASYEGPQTRPSDPNTTEGVKQDLVSVFLETQNACMPCAILLTVCAFRPG